MFERIVAAIDSDPERSVKVIQATGELARACGSSVVVAHIRDVERPAAAVSGKAGAIPPSLHLESEEEARQIATEDVQFDRLARAHRAGKDIFDLGPIADNQPIWKAAVKGGVVDANDMVAVGRRNELYPAIATQLLRIVAR